MFRKTASIQQKKEPNLDLSKSIYCLVLAGVVIAIKLLWAESVPASALFADDYDSLNRAIFYHSDGIRASAEKYPFVQASAGLTYFLAISPWVYFDLEHRLFFVFFVNILLSGVSIYFCARTIYKLAPNVSFVIPLCLASLASLFQFSFYVMTENMLFAILSVLVFLSVDFLKTVKSPFRLLTLLSVLGIAPITRHPGMAVLPGMLLVLWLNRRALSMRSMLTLTVLLISATLVPYAWYVSLFGTSRESKYIDALSSTLSDLGNWFFIFKLTLSQLMYLTFASGIWLLPFLLLAVFYHQNLAKADSERWRNFLGFILPTVFAFVGFCMIHMIAKVIVHGAVVDSSPWFPYGRYIDPAVLLCVCGGLASLAIVPTLKKYLRVLVQIGVPLLFVVLLMYFNGGHWVPINYAGISMFAKTSIQFQRFDMFSFWLLLFVITAFLCHSQKYRVLTIAIFVLFFNLLNIHFGMNYTIKRARNIEGALVAANWIDKNIDVDSSICYDFNVIARPAPRGIKKMGVHFKAMMFRTYPRDFVLARDRNDLEQCDYFYTLRDVPQADAFDVAWKDKDFILFSLSQKLDSRDRIVEKS